MMSDLLLSHRNLNNKFDTGSYVYFPFYLPFSYSAPSGLPGFVALLLAGGGRCSGSSFTLCWHPRREALHYPWAVLRAPASQVVSSDGRGLGHDKVPVAQWGGGEFPPFCQVGMEGQDLHEFSTDLKMEQI